MEAKNVVGIVRSAVQKAGDDQISAKTLLRFLDALDDDAASSVERVRQAHELRLTEYQAVTQSNLEMFRSVMEAGKEALNALILIGGGAAIALISFLGNKADAELGKGLLLPLKLFGSAVLIGALCHGFRYLCQVTYSAEKVRIGNVLTAFTIAAALAGYGCFGWGVTETASAFGRFFR